MSEELVNQVRAIPAEQLKQAVMSWVSGNNVEIPEDLKSFLVLQSKGIDVADPETESDFSKTASYEEWSAAFHEWIESHRGQNLPIPSDEAISRESIYYDERLS